MAVQRSRRGRLAGDLCRNAAYESGVEGADQQDRPQRCAWHRPDDAGGALPPRSCEDVAPSLLSLTRPPIFFGLAIIEHPSTTKNQSAVYEIDPALDRHEVDDRPVLRRERLDVSSAVPVRFSKRVLRDLGREQDARLGKRDPSPLVRWQCR